MAIYLDANILWSWRTFQELDRLALSIVARQLGQKIFVPEIAAREAEQHYRRSLEAAVDAHESALRDLRRKFNQAIEAHLEPQPWVSDAVDTWRSRLGELATVIPTEPDDAVEALSREILGVAPTKTRVRGKPGAGARDAAIWLTVLRHHQATNEPGALVTANSDDFAEDARLHPDLEAELGGHPFPLDLYLSLEGLIDSLGKPTTGNELSSDDLETLARDTLATAIAHREDVLTAYWSGLEPELRYRTDLGEARVTRIRQQRRYERGDEAVTLVDADWDLDVHPGFQDTDTGEPALWSRFADSTRLHARIQLFVSESEGSPVGVEFISARWWSRESIFRTSSGAFMTITGVPPEGEDENEEGDNERGSTGAGEADSGRG